MGIATSIYDAALDTLAKIKSYLGTDEKENLIPVHSSKYDIDAVDWNTIVAGLGEVALRTRFGNLCAYQFSHPNVAASQTNLDIYHGSGGDTALLQFVAPWDGSLVALGVRVENARSAGTLTVKWTIDGAEQTLSVVINGDHTQTNYNTQLPGVEEFAAGDLIGVSITTDGSWAAGSTPSINVHLVAAYGE